MTTDNKPPREFWIIQGEESLDESEVWSHKPQKDSLHVIEHSAYAALEAKYQKAVVAFAKLTDEYGWTAASLRSYMLVHESITEKARENVHAARQTLKELGEK